MVRRTLILPLGSGIEPTDYYTKQQVDQLLSAKEDSADLATVAETGSYSDLTNKPNYGASLSMTIDSQTFVLTAQLIDQNGNALGASQTVDLPLESVVVSGSYDAQTKKVILTLQNGSTIEFSVADLVSGLQTEITAQNPLSADLLADGTTNKVFTATEQSKLSGIESGAQVNVKPDWNAASGTAAEILNKPTIPAAQVQSDWNQSDNSAVDYIKNKPAIPSAQVQSDWNQSDDMAVDYIKNKPDAIVNIPFVPSTKNDGTVIRGIVQDYDGNWYDGVILNDSIWLASNLKTTHYADGTAVTYGDTTYATDTAYYYYPDREETNVDDYGLLYNWYATTGGVSSTDNPSGIQGIAPTGWHIPSNEEVTDFETYIGTVQDYILNDNPLYIAKALASKTGWTNDPQNYTPGNNPQDNNATNFGLMPAGRVGDWGEEFSQYGAIWTATQLGTPSSYARTISSSYAYTLDQGYMKGDAVSVRCVMDMSATDWYNANKDGFFLKDGANGMEWVRLSAVATSGSYNDLTNKPSIPAAQVNSDWNASSGVAEILNKPTIPTVNDATITIQQDGTTVGTFTTNDANDTTINLTGGGGGSDWYGTQAQFDTLQQKDADTNYFISDKIDYNTDIKNKPKLDKYATKSEVQTADATLNSKIAGKMANPSFMTAQEFSQITPKEGEDYFIQGETVAMTFTLAGGSTVTYNVVVD